MPYSQCLAEQWIWSVGQWGRNFRENRQNCCEVRNVDDDDDDYDDNNNSNIKTLQ